MVTKQEVEVSLRREIHEHAHQITMLALQLADDHGLDTEIRKVEVRARSADCAEQHLFVALFSSTNDNEETST